MEKPPQSHIDLLDSMEDYARQTSAKFWELKLRDIVSVNIDGKLYFGKVGKKIVLPKPTNNTQSRSRS